jgi:hypothetical protein
MTKRISGAGVNRSAARKASQVSAARRARLAAHEAEVSAAVAVFFDRTGRAGGARDEASVRAARIVADAEHAAVEFEREADRALARLRELGEAVTEIAAMTDLPVATVRAALARAGSSGTRTAAGPGPGGDGTRDP